MGPARVEAPPWRVVEQRPNGFLAVRGLASTQTI